MQYLGWLEMVIGVWVLISPWVFGFASINTLLWSNVVSGMLLIILSLWELFGKDSKNP